MLKYLIADDEEIIRNGLKYIIDWEDCGFRFCGEASNGKDAVSQIIDLQPDLVMLDIRMPGLSGIEVMNQINEYFNKKNLPVPAFIILTGFSEFEFAKDALNYGAKAYLLKPVDEIELEKNVRNIAKEISRQRNLEETSKNAKIIETKEYLLKLIQTEAISGFKNPADANFFDNSENSNFQAIIFSMDYYNQKNRKELEQAIFNYFSFFTKVLINQKNEIILILKTKNQTAANNCIERAANLFESRTFITSGNNLIGLEGLVKSYEQALTNKNFLFYYADKKCIFPDDVKTQKENESIGKFTSEINEQIDKIIFCVETYNKNQLEKIIDYLYEIFYNIEYSESICKKNIIYCLLELRNKLSSKYPEREITDGATFDVVPKILEKKTFEQTFEYFKNILYDFVENFNFNTVDSMIVKVIAYIKSNYNRDLKLENLGEMFNCNSAYLGKKFKKYTGEQFNTYLDNLRIEDAKDKLKNTDLKIYQISKLVGYTNTDYFFMKFKKNTGMTPKEYKSKLENENDE